ncbi:DcaP family trimeric outer membrane transporter [Actimicrobium sp. CCC2.4]|uniref:DcaP family trimeric outer membrane transporter n=1 Tax=Actimicrobium sp. CCC2.4 TaxID=3048606 RepID=UPI002AC8D71F|nr:DcaP family trimeric outer membrane transporter [Actimicrobium sp. CCC2.4]MEB0136875.1 DcaP family trimeric outer membrane transporter [Actimicrobium sp. CCC2.4]WPX33426.1 DcaP family trimeric outer membrane transporter [Actimicrobium sp. CCC2.4]
MHLKRTTLSTAILLSLATISLPSQAQSAKDFKEMRTEMQRMRAELDALKAEKRAPAPMAAAVAAPVSAPVSAPAPAQAALNTELADRIEQVELRSKDAVVVGDIPNSFRLPNSETSLRIYGFAELNMVHEFRADNADTDYASFVPYAPLNGSAGANRSGRTYLHARTSRLGIEASTPTQYGPMGIKLEGDFNNDPRTGNAAVTGTIGNIYTQQATNSYDFRLRQAYGTFGGLLIGQTWSTFMDVDNAPETVDFNGPIGSTFIRQPMIRYAYPTKDYGTFTVAAENSVSYVLDKTGSVTTAGFSRVPDLVGRWDKPFDFGAVSFRVVSHEHRVNDGAGINASRRGFGVAASGMYKTVGEDFLTWNLTGGTGIGRYFNYIEGAFYDPAANRILMEKAVGVVVGYQIKSSPSLRYNMSVGAQKNFNNEYTEFARANALDSGRYGVNESVWQTHLGFIWNPVKNVDIGTELVYGKRKTLAGETGDMSRLDFSAKYNFN